MDWYTIFGGNKKSSIKINRNNRNNRNNNSTNNYYLRKNNKSLNNNYNKINDIIQNDDFIKRNEHETDLSFKSRKIFLLAATDGNTKKINEDLIQLSNIFVNVTILGCSYPSQVLKKVSKIADKIKNTTHGYNL